MEASPESWPLVNGTTKAIHTCTHSRSILEIITGSEWHQLDLFAEDVLLILTEYAIHEIMEYFSECK